MTAREVLLLLTSRQAFKSTLEININRRQQSTPKSHNFAERKRFSRHFKARHCAYRESPETFHKKTKRAGAYIILLSFEPPSYT